MNQLARVTVSPNPETLRRFKADEPGQTKEPVLPSLTMESGQRSSPQSINRPHPSPHLCSMTGYGYIHHAVIVSNRA